MSATLDCLVSHFGLDEHERSGYRRYFCYHVIAGPGPTPGAGLALVTTLAVSDPAERCASCEALHLAETGGPVAALVAALRYLDGYHGEDHLWKVQSDVRGLRGNLSTDPVPSPEACERATQGVPA